MGARAAASCAMHKRIVGAATGDDELLDFCFGKNEAVESVHDGERGEEGDGVEEIVRMGRDVFWPGGGVFRDRRRRSIRGRWILAGVGGDRDRGGVR